MLLEMKLIGTTGQGRFQPFAHQPLAPVVRRKHVADLASVVIQFQPVAADGADELRLLVQGDAPANALVGRAVVVRASDQVLSISKARAARSPDVLRGARVLAKCMCGRCVTKVS